MTDCYDTTHIMTERIIPIADARYNAGPAFVPNAKVLASHRATGRLDDQFSRPLRDLRISVTDRCNFRCTYCMPKSVFDKDYAYLPQSSLLSFEEIETLTQVFIAHGVEKIRLTGGEPLLRKNIEALIERLAKLTTAAGQPLDITLTTNASLLPKKAQGLKDAGLKRITVSLDALDDATFRAMNDVDFPVSDVLEGIEAAHRVGLTPLKINMVVKRGVNEHQVLPMARFFKSSGHVLRYIEFMDVGASNGWKMDDVVASKDIISLIHAELPLTSLEPDYRGEVAQRWAYADGSGEVGVISSVTQAFCGDCTRARLSTEGKLFTCLFAQTGFDLRSLLRDQRRSPEELSAAIAHVWQQRNDRYSALRTNSTQGLRKVEMSYIGG
jgi:GTP 3',8-cyclase